MVIAIVNQSRDLTDRDAVWIERAMRVQMEHVARAYQRAPIPVKFFSDHRAIFGSTEVWPIILADDTEGADALGWHTKLAGEVYSYVFVGVILSAGYDVLRGTPVTVSGVAGHELGEMTMDPDISLFVKLPVPRPEGDMVAYEIGDPVQDEYEAKVGFLGLRQTVQLSNFVHPSWFKRGPHPSGTKFDEKGELKQPFTKLPTGYLIIQDSKTGRVTSVFDEQPRAWKRSQLSRTHRRGVNLTPPRLVW